MPAARCRHLGYGPISRARLHPLLRGAAAGKAGKLPQNEHPGPEPSRGGLPAPRHGWPPRPPGADAEVVVPGSTLRPGYRPGPEPGEWKGGDRVSPGRCWDHTPPQLVLPGGWGALGGLSAPFSPEALAPRTMPDPCRLTADAADVPPSRPKAAFRDPSLGTPAPPGRGVQGLSWTRPMLWAAARVFAFRAQTGPATAQSGPRGPSPRHLWPQGGRTGWGFRSSGSSPPSRSCLVSPFPERRGLSLLSLLHPYPTPAWVPPHGAGRPGSGTGEASLTRCLQTQRGVPEPPLPCSAPGRCLIAHEKAGLLLAGKA